MVCTLCGRGPGFVQNPWPGLESREKGASIPVARRLDQGMAKHSLADIVDAVNPLMVAKFGSNPPGSPYGLQLSQKQLECKASWQRKLSQIVGYVPVAVDSWRTPADPQDKNCKRRYMLQ